MNKLNTYQLHHGQTWFDVSLKLYGTPIYALDLALLNQSSLTQELFAGTFIDFSDQKSDKTVLAIYQNNKTNPATGFSKEDIQILQRQEGISIWAINLDFVIS